MNIQGYLEDTYRIIKAEPVILLLGGLVVQLLTILTMGILAGPFLGGYLLLIILYMRENRKPTFNDIFSGLKQFSNLLPYFLVLLTIFIGFMLLIIPGFVLATWWLYVLPLMVDRKISFSEAMKLSTKKVNETGFLMHFVFLLLISVIPIMLLNFLSTMIPFLFVLKILLPPLQAGCLVSLYVDKFGSEKIEGDKLQETTVKETSVTPEENAAAESDLKSRPPEENQASEESSVLELVEDQAGHVNAAVQEDTPNGPAVDKEQTNEEISPPDTEQASEETTVQNTVATQPEEVEEIKAEKLAEEIDANSEKIAAEPHEEAEKDKKEKS